MLSPAALLSNLERRGVRLVVQAGRIFAPPGALDDADKGQIRAMKPELMTLLVERLAHSLMDTFEERSAIAEHDGGLSRTAADALARRGFLDGMGFMVEEVAILWGDPWGPGDLLRLAQLRAMAGGGEVVPRPSAERVVDGMPVRPKEAA